MCSPRARSAKHPHKTKTPDYIITVIPVPISESYVTSVGGTWSCTYDSTKCQETRANGITKKKILGREAKGGVHILEVMSYENIQKSRICVLPNQEAS
jgi:hypothetical protein